MSLNLQKHNFRYSDNSNLILPGRTGLVAAWDMTLFDGALIDLSGNGNAPDTFSNIIPTEGIIGNAIYFPGVDSYMAKTTAIPDLTNIATIVMRFKVDDVSSDSILFAHTESASSRIGVGIDATGVLSVLHHDGSDLAGVSGDIGVGWHTLIAYINDHSDITAWLDGVPITDALVEVVLSSTVGYTIGAATDESLPSEGIADEIWLYNQIRSAPTPKDYHNLRFANIPVFFDDFSDTIPSDDAVVPPGWGIVSGTVKIQQLAQDVDYLKRGQNYLIGLESYNIFAPVDVSYPTIEFDYYKGADSSALNFMLSQHPLYLIDGYNFNARGVEQWRVRRYAGGVQQGADLLVSSIGSIPRDEWLHLRVARLPGGETPFYQNDVLVDSDAGGDNPFTDNNFTKLDYLTLRGGAADRFTNFKVLAGVAV